MKDNERPCDEHKWNLGGRANNGVCPHCHDELVKSTRSVFVSIIAEAVTGLADGVIVGEILFPAQNALAWVKKLAAFTNELKETARSEFRLEREALRESVKLQSHYAMLLNGYDGGARLIFKNENEWVKRYFEVKAGNEEKKNGADPLDGNLPSKQATAGSTPASATTRF